MLLLTALLSDAAAGVPLVEVTLATPQPITTFDGHTLTGQILTQPGEYGTDHLLALGSRVVLTHRARDSMRVYRVENPRGDLLLVETTNGGPGTCVWGRQVTGYFINDSLDGAPRLVPSETVPLGGYLQCEDGHRACGCGTWEATWEVSAEAERIRVTTSPTVTSERGAALDAPAPLSVSM